MFISIVIPAKVRQSALADYYRLFWMPASMTLKSDAVVLVEADEYLKPLSLQKSPL